jgi:diguanylate cyclase (GGDEF)-like protein
MGIDSLGVHGTASRVPTWVRTLQGVLASTVVVYVVSLLVRDRSDYSLVFEGIVANVALGLSAVLCLLRGVVVRAASTGFVLLGLGGLMFTAGNVAYVAHVQYLDPVPYPSISDVGYLGAYPFFVVAVVLFARAELGRQHLAVWVDGLVGALGMAAVGSALVLHTTLHDLSGDAVALIVGGAYSLADLLLLSMIVGVFTLRGRRPDRRWSVLAGGLVVFAVADIVYLLRLSTDSYVQGSLLDGLWVIGLAVLSFSAFQPTRERVTSRSGSGFLGVTIVFSLLAVVVLVAASEIPMPRYAIGLAALTLVAGAFRAAIAFRQVRSVAELRHQVRTDDLTGLPNRRAFSITVDEAVTSSAPGAGFAILVIDIGQFNELNELFGHDIGERLLLEIAPRLSTILRTENTLSRLGGGEFALLIAGGTAESAARIGRRVCEALLPSFVLDDMAQQVSGHVGIALWPAHANSAHGLLQCADVAMRSARSQRSAVEIYDPVHGADGRNRLMLAKQLRIAVETNQFVVHYQPKVELHSGTVVGVEALVRWEHPERGLLYPDSFLPIAEQIGCMNALTRSVLATSITQCSQWRLDGVELAMAVNLSASDLLDTDLVGHIAMLLTTAGVPPHLLELEITETTLMVDPPSARATLAAIHALGVKLSVDDYGTGFSSLAYLRDLPVQELKIDRTFVTDLTDDSRGAAIVKSTVDLAHTLGLTVLAEGVENDEAFDLLRSYGCDVAQGFHLCRPKTAAELTRWFRTQTVHVAAASVCGIDVVADDPTAGRDRAPLG